jgi:hypothetical protein
VMCLIEADVEAHDMSRLPILTESRDDWESAPLAFMTLGRFGNQRPQRQMSCSKKRYHFLKGSLT